MMSITFCLDVGNDWYFILLCNLGGLIMRSFQEREGASGKPPFPTRPAPPPPPVTGREKKPGPQD